MNNIKLTELHLEDSKTLLKWINTRSLVINNNSYKPIHEYDHNDWFTRVTSDSNVRIFGIRMYDNEKNLLIGTCQLYNIDIISRSAELAIRIGEEIFQGKGYGYQAITSLINFGFNDLNLNRIYLQVFNTNQNAIKLYTNIGFQNEGILRQSIFIDGCYRDIHIMALLKGEYI